MLATATTSSLLGPGRAERLEQPRVATSPSPTKQYAGEKQEAKKNTLCSRAREVGWRQLWTPWHLGETPEKVDVVDKKLQECPVVTVNHTALLPCAEGAEGMLSGTSQWHTWLCFSTSLPEILLGTRAPTSELAPQTETTASRLRF